MQPQLTQARTRITKLMIKDTGTYNAFYPRGYQTSADPGTVHSIVERVGSSDRFSPMLMSGIAGQYLQPSATPDNPNPIAIPQGWEGKRGRFMMELLHEFPGMGYQAVEMVTGFTNYDGFTVSGAIDPKMEFYANSCILLRHLPMVQTPLGMQANIVVVDNSHVLADTGFSTIYGQNKEQKMRPQDVYSAMSRINAQTSGTTTDMRTTLTHVAEKSRRMNSLPSEYMAGILENHRVAAIAQDLGSGEQDILASARGKAAEPATVKDPFLSALAQIRNSGASKVFTYHDLQILDPSVDSVAVVGFSPPAELAKMHVANSGETAPWNGSNQETVIATMLSQAVVALMMEVGIGEIGFKATNQTVGQQFYYQEYALFGFANQNMGMASNLFRDALQAKLWNDLTAVPGQLGAQFLLFVDVHARVMGETRIKVQFENNPMVEYAVPTFCDSLFVPVITTNLGQAETLARDFRELISVVQNETSGFQAYDQGGQNLFGRT